MNIVEAFLAGKTDREIMASRVAKKIPIDVVYEDNAELFRNCEWAIRHANESDYWTTKSELEYYLKCLKGEFSYSDEERDRALAKIDSLG